MIKNIDFKQLICYKINMKQTEITVRVFDSLENILSTLKKQNFEIVEDYLLNDFYFSKFAKNTLKTFDYETIMQNSFLVREIKASENKTMLVYKHKYIDKNNVVVEEEKVQTQVSNLNATLEIFRLANLETWCELEQHIFVLKKENIEFCVSEIKDLGIFIEYEETEDMFKLKPYEKIEYMQNILKSLNLKLGSDFSCKKPYLKFKNSF